MQVKHLITIAAAAVVVAFVQSATAENSGTHTYDGGTCPGDLKAAMIQALEVPQGGNHQRRAKAEKRLRRVAKMVASVVKAAPERCQERFGVLPSGFGAAGPMIYTLNVRQGEFCVNQDIGMYNRWREHDAKTYPVVIEMRPHWNEGRPPIQHISFLPLCFDFEGKFLHYEGQ